MLSTYEDYEPEPMSLTLDEMAALHREMAGDVKGDTEALELYKDLYTAAVKYSESRSTDRYGIRRRNWRRILSVLPVIIKSS